MTKFVIKETLGLLSSIIFKTIMVLHRGMFVFVHLAYIQLFLSTLRSYGKICTKKLPFFHDYGAVSPHFKSTVVKFDIRVRTADLGLPPSRQIL